MDTYTYREPLGVCAGVTPFNFPAMIPLWVGERGKRERGKRREKGGRERGWRERGKGGGREGEREGRRERGKGRNEYST